MITGVRGRSDDEGRGAAEYIAEAGAARQAANRAANGAFILFFS
jgi:hypothetical protein